MEHLKRKFGIILYEYYCPLDDKFFWISKKPLSQLICPYCGKMVYINGEIPIKNMEIDEKKRKNTIPEI